MVKINARFNQILEKNEPQQPTYAEIFQNSQNSQNSPIKTKQTSLNNLPPSPRVVIPIRKDLEQKYNLGKNKSPNPMNKETRLVLKVPLAFLDNLDSMKLRDQINDEFFKKGYNDPIIAAISRSTTNMSLIITTMERFPGSFLSEKKEV